MKPNKKTLSDKKLDDIPYNAAPRHIARSMAVSERLGPMTDFLPPPHELAQAIRKTSITIRIDPDILEWYKSLGGSCSGYVNAVLRAYMEAWREKM